MKNIWSKLVKLFAAAFAAALLIGGVPGYAGSVPVYAEECAGAEIDSGDDSVSIESGTELTLKDSGKVSPCVDEKPRNPGNPENN